MNLLWIAEIPKANAMTIMAQMAKNDQKIATNGQKCTKMVAKNQVGQREVHMDMLKKIFLPIWYQHLMNLRFIATKNIKHPHTKSEYWAS